jgi:hypothetical protein
MQDLQLKSVVRCNNYQLMDLKILAPKNRQIRGISTIRDTKFCQLLNLT